MNIRHGLIALTLLAMAAAPAVAQEVVPVGKGSYAATPVKDGQPEGKQVYVLDQKDRPLPSNHYFSHMLVTNTNNQLWSYPFRIDVNNKGLDFFIPQKWNGDGGEPVCDNPLTVSGAKVTNTLVKDWSNWTMSFRQLQSDTEYLDVTVGEGMPCTWIEFTGISPVLSFRGAPKFFGQSADGIGIDTAGHIYGVFGPDGVKFDTTDNKTVKVTFGAGKQYLVICALTAQKDLETFHKYAFALPRAGKVTWAWDSAKALETTKWTLTTEALKGDNKQIIQGWIPHHYRKTINDLKLADLNLTYLSPRGPLKCSVGNEFNIAWEFTGIIPNLPAPKKLGLDHDFDADRMHSYFTALIDQHRHPQNANDVHFIPDTYWGGKDILRFGQMGLMSQQLGDNTHDDFVKDLRVGMEDWYTYTPGEPHHFFERYPKWHALVGINTSYGSENFNDHHFHYGYFTFASALLGMQDPSFLKDYGGMATLVAKEYGNYDRNDKDFPFMRCFDIWAGHGWADGFGAPNGNNEESTSEDVQSSAGLIYLGQAKGNKDMTEAGIAAYAMTTQAALEYWFNQGGDVFPPEWKAPSNGILRSGRKEFTKFFQGDDAWIFAIQWLPTSPMLSYLARDPVYAKGQFDKMLDRAKAKGQATSVKGGWGAGLGNVLVGYVLQYDPQWAVEQLNEIAGDPKINVAYEWAVIYYQAHSMRNLGLVDWKVHGTSPTSMTYYNAKTKVRTFVAWNPTTKAETVKFYEGSNLLGQLTANPQTLTSATSLASAAGN